jgi:hypothetical protein
LIVDPVLPDNDVLASFSSCRLGNHFKEFSHASQFSMRPMKKMRLQPTSPRLKMATIDVGAGVISRDVASGGGFWTTFSQRTFCTIQ